MENTETKQTNWEELSISYDFLFGKIMQNPELFLDYVAGKKPEDSFVEKLEEAVKEAKKNRERRREYITLLMRD